MYATATALAGARRSTGWGCGSAQYGDCNRAGLPGGRPERVSWWCDVSGMSEMHDDCYGHDRSSVVHITEIYSRYDLPEGFRISDHIVPPF